MDANTWPVGLTSLAFPSLYLPFPCGCVIQGVFEKGRPLLRRMHFLTEELPEDGLDGQDNDANYNKQDIHLRSMK